MSIISLYEKSDKLFFVGGVVRDELLGKTSPDIDLTYVGDAIEFAKTLGFGEILQVNEEFGSVHLKIDDNIVEITSTRTETYPKKGQLPLVQKIGCELKEDVIRRDFTINALVKNCKTGEILDFVNGKEDLKNKKLRILHEKSFIDDPTRIIRGLKFAVRFGLELEENTLKLQEEYLNNVNYEMSFKRLKDQLTDAFNLNKQEVLDRFIEQKMYKLLSKNSFVEYKPNVEDFIAPYTNEIQNIWLVYLGGFDLSNLPLTKQEMKVLEDYKKLLYLDLSDDFCVYRAFENLNIESLLIYGLIKNSEIVKRYLNILRKIKIDVTGKDLISIGFEPSAKIQQVLDLVLKEKLKNPELTKSEQIEFCKKHVK